MTEWAKQYPWTAKAVVWWTVLLVSAVTIKAFFDPEPIPSGTVAALGTVYGLPAVSFGLYKARLKIEEVRRGSQGSE